MSDPQYLLYVGSGVYIDSNGRLVQGTPQKDIPLYHVPSLGLPVQPDAVKKALDGIAKALPNDSDSKMAGKLRRLGLDDRVIHILGVIGEIAGTLASVVAVVGFAIDFLKLIGVFGSDKDALSKQMEDLTAELKKEFDEIIIKLLQADIDNEHHAIDTAIGRLQTYATGLRAFPPDAATLVAQHQDVRNQHDNAFTAIDSILDPDKWYMMYRSNAYKIVWSNVNQGPLYCVTSASQAHPGPGTTTVNLPHAVPPPEGTPRFDHRMMVPIVLHELERYLTLIKGITPEYRSTGEFASFLRMLAPKLDTLAEEMAAGQALEGGNRTVGTLARTVHLLSDFQVDLLDAEVDDPRSLDGGFLGTPSLSWKCIRWQVGALDLCRHNDAFFAPSFPWYLTLSAYVAFNVQPAPEKVGSMNLRWRPPARLEREWVPASIGVQGHYVYRITNPEECLQAANQQAEQDYADVLLESGYVNLVHTAAALRHLSTEPDVSETVAGDTNSSRQPEGDQVYVTATSPNIPLTGVISSPALLQNYKCHTSAVISTQPLGRQRQLQYRVVLRTLVGRSSRQDPEYSDFQTTDYVDDPDHPTFKRLYIDNLDGRAVGEYELISSTSPSDRQDRQGEAILQAHTFDWYVAETDLRHRPVTTSAGHMLQDLYAAGWSPDLIGEALPVRDFHPFRHSLRVRVNAIETIGDFLFPATPINGQHRHVDESTVHIQYSLTWQGTDLSVSLLNRPKDRNYIVFLVVEEELVSGQWLHTAFPVHMDGQITTVPQSFFDQEAAAIAWANKVLSEMVRLYSISARPRPGDPVIGASRPGDMVTLEGLQRLEDTIRQADPQLFNQVLREHQPQH